MSKSTKTTGDQYPTTGETYKAAPATCSADWWYSTDGRRGFCWADVCAYDYKQGGTGTVAASFLYLYVQSGIFHLVGNEADAVYKELVNQRIKT
jgi:hypothetical protein